MRIIACAGIYILKCFQPLQWNESKLLTGTSGECWGVVVLKHMGWLSQVLSLTAAEAGSFSPPPITYTAALFAWIPAQSIARTAGDSPAQHTVSARVQNNRLGVEEALASGSRSASQLDAVHRGSGMGGRNCSTAPPCFAVCPQNPDVTSLPSLCVSPHYGRLSEQLMIQRGDFDASMSRQPLPLLPAAAGCTMRSRLPSAQLEQ